MPPENWSLNFQKDPHCTGHRRSAATVDMREAVVFPLEKQWAEIQY
jgi:hypothetical protein